MEILAVVAGVVIAVSGWIVAQYQARRGVRRNMRIDYLLGAYRRLERASNRPMTADDDREVETAVADIQLLGSPAQVQLAIEFTRAFATDGRADTEPLLQDLRTSLRSELLLEPVPPQRLWLRIDRDGGTASERSQAWHDTSRLTRQAVDVELAGDTVPSDYDEAFPARMHDLAVAEPAAAMDASLERVEHVLRTLITSGTSEDVAALNTSQLASRALQAGMIDVQLADAINGLTVMRLMAATDRSRLELDKVLDFISLCAGVLYVLNRAGAHA